MTPTLSRNPAPRTGGWLALAATALMLVPMARAADPVLTPAPEAEGLVRQPSRSLGEYYLRPGTSFGGYHKVMLAPVDVSFAGYWAKEHRDIDAAESLRIRQDLARMAQVAFRQVLQHNKGYPVVEAPGPDVLEVRASLVNLDLYAPEVRDAAIRHDYVLSAGEATLVAELRDSQTGTLLARVIDRREMRTYPRFQLADTISNSTEVRDLVSTWARLLRRQLDSAKSDNKGP